ncbi:class I tRNA ligase family protein [Streptomyces gamaensis]|uniref:Class I tRNA ligase family protein n=1 Tax=Streptomyces gamaensis TaxID=1763542 RepID=A0ABW0YVC7_9ACTN
MSAPLWITATPPAPHGELHIGHLAGPYVAADVLRRFLRADGQDVLLTTGTADHSGSVALRALRQGRKPAEVAEGYREAITADWQRCGVEFDHVVAPRSGTGYRPWVQETFRALYAEGLIAGRARLLPYCEPCGQWLHGAHVTGECPHCGAACGGGHCRACARPNDGADLTAPTCAVCGAAAAPRRCRRLYLALEPLREELADHWRAAALPPRLAALCRALLDDGLPELAVSHPGEWGTPVPVDAFADHRIDARFEEAAITLYGGGLAGPDEDVLPRRTAHFGGFGHAFVQAVLLPALLLARGVKLPQDFFVNETFRRYDEDEHPHPPGGPGRRPEVWALDLLTEFGSDTLRRYVLAARPLARGTGFRREDLVGARRVLDGTWNAWTARLLAAVRERHAGLVPEAAPGGTGWDVLHRRLVRAAEDLREAYAPDSFDPRRAVALLDEVLCATADFGHVNDAVHDTVDGGADDGAALVAQLAVAGALTAWARPVMPEGADRLAASLRLPKGRPVDASALAAPAPGTRLAPPSGPVFGF